ncbi:MAG TPA: secondary thiamine-phosphate synthase enzyme YjbQ [Desulfosalsimonadaceae bacterium]|nr:secondary thiamine-phosphate synthase enzyme YjbQ [Desulfosalsimonadaceae bacterium]
MFTSFTDQIQVDMETGVSMEDVTGAIRSLVHRSGVTAGSVHICGIGSTGSLTTIEYEPGAVEDLRRAINRMAPPDIAYEHEKTWQDGNGHSHVQAAIIGPSLTLPVKNGDILSGTWQQVVLINHDNRPRKRRVEICVIGEKQA